jgi:formylglycine-generating enzyme required for sulfatase activity
MAEQNDSQLHIDDESESLRKTLEQMRKEAEEEVTRLNNRLAERDYAPDSSIATATERLALQQEMTMLQQTLEAKEQALDHITEECRRLEDELEDQNIAYDSLKQEIERRDKSLKDAHAELERLRKELSESKRALDSRPSQAPSPIIIREKAKIPRGVIIGGVVTLFVLLSLTMVLILYQLWSRADLPLPQIRPLTESQTPAARALADDTPTTESPRAGLTAPLASASAPSPETKRLPSPRTFRDRLRSGGTGPNLIALQGGVFLMGYNSLSGQDFSPAHEVRVPPFMIGMHEVTFREYERFALATGRAPPNDHGWGRGDRPVVGVTWYDASAYAEWLTQQTDGRYRLPSEAEWEFAARAGTQSPFWWGFQVESGHATCFDCGTRWDNRSTAPVKTFAPNPFGLYDTAGNAMEWIADCYRPSYQGAPNDGSVRLDGDCMTRVARGGAFNKPSSSIRSYIRARFAPETELNMLGFRVARDS